jgi:signal transduction histidine kinase/DNA-binding response OmpR family regulator/HAMP domain-containing protein
MRNLIIFVDDQVQFVEFVEQLSVNQEEAYKMLDILGERYLGPKSDIIEIRREFVTWNISREETIRQLRLGNKQEAINRIKPSGEGGVHIARLFERTNKVDQFAKNKAEQFYNESLELRRRLNNQLLIFTIIALLFTLLIVRDLIRAINKPLKELVQAIESYRAGDKQARSKYTSKNQFGQLSKEFNEMVDKIETDNLISNQSSQLSGIMLSQNDAQNFGQEVLKNLLQYTNSQMGAIYLINEQKSHFECFTSIGVSTQACSTFAVAKPEGQFGIALSTKKIDIIRDIPQECPFTFNTVTGSLKPREIITIPIYNGDEAEAIISLFTINNYSDTSVRLVENIFHTLTARMNGIIAYKLIIETSKKLEVQNTELDAQKRELTTMSDELKEQNAELEMQKQQLGEVNRLKSNFLSSMSHELRTPLNSVIALSGVLNRRLASKIDKEEYSYVGVIERNGKHLLNLINDILDLSRIESGKVEIEKNNFKISALLQEVISMIKPQADQKNIELNLKSENNQIFIESDYNKCFHIFQNIIGNAVKFTEKGQVEVSVSISKATAVVQIKDTGIGISKEDIPLIFDEFRQADGSNSRRFGGTGLGLSIAKKYAEMIGCQIIVESEPGIGSLFTVRIPIESQYSSKDVVSISPELTTNIKPNIRQVDTIKKTILLVEDTDAMIVQIKDILESNNYNIEVAKNGFEAIDYLQTNTPDGMILDLMMPGMDGFQVLDKIRINDKTYKLPVLVLTAKILDKEEIAQIKEKGAYQLIQKGKITKDNLLDAIALMLTKQQKSPATNQINVIPVKITGLPKILAFEDNADNMLALKALLVGNCQFIEATDGIDGIEKANAVNPDIILMDIAMPGMNGFDALIKIRNTEHLKHTPVIVITSSAMRGDKDYFLEYGFNGYVSKPINNELLFQEINKWLIK